MADYDEVIRWWSDLGAPERPVVLDVYDLGGFVSIEQEHIEQAAELGDNPDVLVRDETDYDDDSDDVVIKTWVIVRLAPQGSYLR